MKSPSLFLGILLSTLTVNAFGQVKEISLSQALDMAEKNNPGLAASKFKETAAEHSIGIAKSGFLPTVNFEAIDSNGFPGSSGLTGVGGLMGSPYRSGAAYGIVAKETIWDFGRTTNSVSEAMERAKFEKEDTRVRLIKVKQNVLNSFFDCSKFRTQRDTWADLAREIQITANEVNHFVKTGQRSVIEKYLVESQSEEALTAEATFEEQLSVATHRLSLMTGLNENQFICPPLPSSDLTEMNSVPQKNNPFILRASQEAKVAQAQIERAKAQHMPTIVAIGSVGHMDDARLVGEQNYSIAAGLVIPLFDGLRTTNEVEKAEAQALQKSRELDEVKLELEEIDTQYDQIIHGTKIEISHLDKEVRLAQKAFKLAKQRYFGQQGSLIDLRESLKNLTRTQTDLINAKTEYLRATISKSITDGG